MPANHADVPINPFSDDIVVEPRRIEAAVKGLNDVALENLLKKMKPLTVGSCPRLHPRALYAELVMSTTAGYGKSHLIGRLFKELQGKATLIYLKPFQDPNSCWRSLLDKIAMELECPDRADTVACAPGELSQLDKFSRRVLAFLLADLTEKDLLPTIDKSRAISLLRRDPDAFFEDEDFQKWFGHKFDTILEEIDRSFQRQEIKLFGGRKAWAKVLFAYAMSNAREACLDWIKYQPLDRGEALSALKLKPAEIPEADLPYEQRNEECFQRILDLLRLSAYYRPFVFCFDQTELFGRSQQLANSFGVVISRLVRDGCNLLPVVTANKLVWDEKVFIQFELADQHTVCPTPIALSGISKSQGKELARNRLIPWQSQEQVDRFTSDMRFTEIFKSKAEVGVRDFLRQCHAIWENTTVIKTPLAELLQEYRRKLLASPKNLQFDAGVLQWIFQVLFCGRCPYKIYTFASEKGYLALKWEGDNEEILFGFEEGNNYKRWQAIHREAGRYHDFNCRRGKMTRAVFFRAPNQSRIPGERWRIREEIEATAQDFFSIFHLSIEEITLLYAAHDLYADVIQGNQEAEEKATLDFLSNELKVWVDRVCNPPDGAERETATIVIAEGLIKALQDIVSLNPFIALDMLQQSLVKVSLQVTKEQIFAACERIPQIKVFASPTNAVFKWIS